MPEPTERLVFPSLVDSYLKGLGPLFSAQTHQELKAAGLDIDRLPPAIPSPDMRRLIEIFARNAWPDAERDERLRLLGLHAIRGWQSTFLGSAAAGLMRVMGPHRTLTRLNRAFRTTNNFSEATTELLGEREALIAVNDVEDMPTYWQGVFQAGLEVLKLEGTVVIDRLEPAPGATYRLTWN